MIRTHYQIAIDRVVVTGAPRVDQHELRGLIVGAVAHALENAPLPAGRTMRANVQMTVPSLRAGGSAVAGGVARGVLSAIGGGPKHG